MKKTEVRAPMDTMDKRGCEVGTEPMFDFKKKGYQLELTNRADDNYDALQTNVPTLADTEKC